MGALTPEEKVRQEYLGVLVEHYGYSLEQIDEEGEVTGRGSGQARADFVIWRSAQDRAGKRNPLIVVECKSDNVTIKPADYGQGDNYARLSGAPFFVTHNSQETRFGACSRQDAQGVWKKSRTSPMPTRADKEIRKILERLKVFKEDEFANLLHECHNVIRNREKKDPAAAFDEIAKILFVKVCVERELRETPAPEHVHRRLPR